MNLVPVTEMFESHPVTVQKDEDGSLWTLAVSLEKPLGMTKSAIRNHIAALHESEKGVRITDTLGGPQEMVWISEAGVVQIAWKSRKPEAKRFRRWSADLIVRYIRGESAPAITPADFYAMAVRVEALERKLSDRPAHQSALVGTISGLQEWEEQHAERDPCAVTASAPLFKSYDTFREAKGLPPVTKAAFGLALKKAGFPSILTGSKRTRARIGIRLALVA